MTTEPDIEELKGAVGDLAHAVEGLADAVKEAPIGDTALKQVAAGVSRTARNIARQLGGDPMTFGATNIPQDVVALAQSGKTIEAVTRYREVTGATLDEAKAVIRDIS